MFDPFQQNNLVPDQDNGNDDDDNDIDDDAFGPFATKKYIISSFLPTNFIQRIKKYDYTKVLD